VVCNDRDYPERSSPKEDIEYPADDEPKPDTKLENRISEATTMQDETMEEEKASEKSEVPTKSDTPSKLRATATAFIPEWAGSIPSVKAGTWEELARDANERYDLPVTEELYPNCPPTGSQNALKLVMPYQEFDSHLYQDAFESNIERVNYDGSQPNVQCFTLVPRLYRDHSVVGNEDYKVQVADPAYTSHKRHQSPARRSDEDELSLRLLKAQLQEQMRGPMLQALEGPGPHLHTMPTPYPMTESMWAPPIGPGHPYDGRHALPSVRAKEWDEIATAIKLLNLGFYDRQRRAGHFTQPQYWEPPIPMGFDERAKFYQPGQRASLRGGGGGCPVGCECGGEACASVRAFMGSEYDWRQVRQSGCAYCGDDRHSTIFCELLMLHGSNAKVRCLNCGDAGHFLCACASPPKFDNDDPRSKKLMFYAHSAHWRETLTRQHARFAPPLTAPTADPAKSQSRTQRNVTAAGDNERTEADAGTNPDAESTAADDGASATAPSMAVGDASAAFAALLCPSCGPEMHWGVVEENVAMVGTLCQMQTQNGCAEDAGQCGCRADDRGGAADDRSRPPAEANVRGRDRSASSTATTGATARSACGGSCSGRPRAGPCSEESPSPRSTAAASHPPPPPRRPFWSEPNWVVETSNCPVVWNVMHKDDPGRCWAIFNPLGSVAVDAFWRTAMAAMGWDAPELPDGQGP
jgi:hypothetical protein